jgi:hypothetical protein
MLDHSHESPIQLQTGPTWGGLAGLMRVSPVGLATGLIWVCLAHQVTGQAGAADGAEIIGQDMVGVQPLQAPAWRTQRLTLITAIPTMHRMATAIMDTVQIMDTVHMRPHTVLTRAHTPTGTTPSRIALDASARTIRQARRISHTAVSGSHVHSGRAIVLRDVGAMLVEEILVEEILFEDLQPGRLRHVPPLSLVTAVAAIDRAMVPARGA